MTSDPLPGSDFHLQEARRYCRDLAIRHYENFPVGRWVERRLRPHMQAIYAFARVADDFADEKGFQGQRLALLAEWRRQLYEASKGRAEHPIFVALADTIATHDIPVEWLDHLIRAFELDVEKTRHPNFASLLQYSEHSANPVGRLVLWLHGYREEPLFVLSDCICTALQLTNFWQDIAIDWGKGRLYLPQEDLVRYGYSEDDLENAFVNQRFCQLLECEIQRTWDLFGRGRSLCDHVRGRLRFELRLIWSGGTHILREIARNGHDVFRHRPTLGTKDKICMFWRSLLWKDSRAT